MTVDPLTVICPYCLADVGRPCIAPRSGRLAPTPHALRREVATRREMNRRGAGADVTQVPDAVLRCLAEAVVSSGCLFEVGLGMCNRYECPHCGAWGEWRQLDKAREGLDHDPKCPVRLAEDVLKGLDSFQNEGTIS